MYGIIWERGWEKIVPIVGGEFYDSVNTQRRIDEAEEEIFGLCKLWGWPLNLARFTSYSWNLFGDMIFYVTTWSFEADPWGNRSDMATFKFLVKSRRNFLYPYGM